MSSCRPDVPTGNRRGRRLLTGLLLGLLAGLVGAACPGDRQEEPTPPDAVYETRGEIAVTPAPGSRSLLIRHESIPEFVSREGESVGMDSMTMPFSVARSLSVDDLEEGDRVDFEFEIRWDGDPILRITRLDKLPGDAELDFSPLPKEATEEPGKERSRETGTESENEESPADDADDADGISDRAADATESDRDPSN